MRRINRNEKRLLIVLAIVLVAITEILGVRWLLGMRRGLQARRLRLEGEVMTAGAWMSDKDVWMERGKWLDATQPRLVSVEKANAELLETLQKTARAQKLSILEQSFAEAAARPHCREVAVRLTVSGSLEAISRWLVEVQQPGRFQAVTFFSMKCDSEPSQLKCAIQIARWYAPAQPL